MTSPEDVKERVSKMLMDLREDGLQDYLDVHVSYETCQQMVKDSVLVEPFLTSFANMTESHFKTSYRMAFQDLRKKGDDLRINWIDIVPYNYEYSLTQLDGMSGLEATLTFAENDHGFSIHILALLYKGEFHVFFIDQLRRNDA